MLAVMLFSVLFIAVAVFTQIHATWLAVFGFIAASVTGFLAAATAPRYSAPVETIWLAYCSVSIVVNTLSVMIGRGFIRGIAVAKGLVPPDPPK